MSFQEEIYIHFVSCIDALNTAWQILQEIKRNEDNPLVGPAFRFALIEYSKPYKYTHGHGSGKHKLGVEHVPDNLSDLHQRILNARDKIHAHSDLTVKAAKLHVVYLEHRKFVYTSQNVIYGTEELPNIDDIIGLIGLTLDSMYIKRAQLEAELPPDSL